MLPHVRAILWAQFRTLFNFYSRGAGGPVAVTVVMSAAWYGMVLFGAWTLAVLLSSNERLALVKDSASQGVFFTFLYWQIVPLFLGAAGASIDLKRLVVYPVTHRELFVLEVLLRFTTGIEVLVLMAGAAAGIAANPKMPWWAAAGFLPWTAFNLFLAVGLRDLLSRLLARRRTREVFTLLMVLLAGAPQLVAIWSPPEHLRGVLDSLSFDWLPWTLTAGLILGERARNALPLLLWTAAAFAFGWSQFRRNLRFDADAARSSAALPSRGDNLIERFYTLPSRLLSDPLGAMVEKELRFLSRAPRFRLVFIMGFSFGLLIWLPMAFRGGRDATGFFAQHYLTLVTFYALLLLGEVLFWNVFGFDRGAAQIYYLLPVPFHHALIGKNLAAVCFVVLEVLLLVAVCALLGMPLGVRRLSEASAVALVMTAYLLAAGNLASTHYPRPINPSQSWRSSSAGRIQALFIVVYPMLAFPIGLAFVARWTFESELVFWAMLAFAAALGALIYWIALESSVTAAERNRETIVTALSAGDGPVTG